MRKSVNNSPPRSDNQGTSSFSSSSSGDMETAEQPEDDIMMDFESGIDTWIIDKDDSVGSFSSLDKTRKEGKREKNMNKENIKQTTLPPDSKSLRSFRMRKRISYQEVSSESESESNKRREDKDVVFQNKRRSGSSNVSKTVGVVNSPTSVCITNEFKRDVESLSCEEISSMLSEVDERDCSTGSNRERLLSIENVSSVIENKSGDLTSSPVKVSLKCNWCNCECTSSEELKAHEETHQNKYNNLFQRNNGIIPVSINDKMIPENKTSSLEVKRAKPIADRNHSLKCTICGFQSAELLIYKSHQILFHSENRDLKCEYCHFKTNLSASLAIHIRIHFQMDCPYCDHHFSLRSSLEDHLSRYHQNAHPYTCKKCGFSCKSQKKFYKHLKLHAIKKYQCDECKEYFSSSKLALKTHIKQHSVTISTFKCHNCDLAFSQKHSLKVHMKCHEKLNGNLSKTHLTARKTFKCEKCDSIFTQENHLKLHMRTHYKKCKYCTFRCADSIDIKNHVCVPVNKLYSVQKRSLNFEGVNTDVKVNNTKTGTGVKEELQNVLSHDKKRLTRNCTLSQGKVVKSKTEDVKKTRKTRPKVLAVRQKLRCFRPERKTEIKNERKNGKLQNNHKNPEKGQRGRPKKIANEKTCQTLTKNNGAFQTDTASINNSCTNKSAALTVRQRKLVRKIRREQLTKGLEATSILFRQKQTMKELMVDQVPFVNNSFVECFYQSQQPSSASTLQEHEERHLRRPSLLSCRYCNYKTNSQRLLKSHVDKNHTWDPAVVSKLFRP